ncbi:hypothetical protein V6N12_005911 [Hibiscus sabdariffa]|uniref:Uncharacterized protein n=1 Tax=Hibiscus sabdariffa TaxID=183260 RepID=A0ABR2EWG2_9ROSI
MVDNGILPKRVDFTKLYHWTRIHNLPLLLMTRANAKRICYPKGLKWKEHIDVLGDALFSAGLEEWEHERKLVRCLLSHHKFRKAMRRLFGTEFRQGSSLSFNMSLNML